VSLNYADLTLEQGLGAPGSYLRYTGDDIGASAAVSLHWRPHEQHAFGLLYSTKSSFGLDGRVRSSMAVLDSDAKLDFMTPARAAAGYSYRPAPGWNIEANIEWLDWDSLNTLTLRTNTMPDTPVPFEWKSSFIYELGVSYTTECGWVFAAGYDFNESSQPDRNFNPGVADADRHWWNAGVGHRGEDRSWLLAYQFGHSNRTVTGAQGVAALANGKYKARHHSLVFTYQHQF
jgi:long-chain fatty acid transport protein